MKAFVVVLPAMFFATTSFAHSHVGSLPSATVSRAPYDNIRIFNQMNDGQGPFHATHDTPTMQRQRLVRAVALRDEAQQLVRRNGGTLTADQERYLRRAAHKILNGSR